MTRQRTFGKQPIQDIIINDGRTVRGFVRMLKGDQPHALLAISGRVPPSTEIRAELSAKLGVPIETLFTKEALAATYTRNAEHRRRRVTV